MFWFHSDEAAKEGLKSTVDDCYVAVKSRRVQLPIPKGSCILRYPEAFGQRLEPSVAGQGVGTLVMGVVSESTDVLSGLYLIPYVVKQDP